MKDANPPHQPVGARWLQKLQRAGDCLKCGAVVPQGSQALWLMNRGIYCEPCGTAYEQAGNPVKGERKTDRPEEGSLESTRPPSNCKNYGYRRHTFTKTGKCIRCSITKKGQARK